MWTRNRAVAADEAEDTQELYCGEARGKKRVRSAERFSHFKVQEEYETVAFGDYERELSPSHRESCVEK